MVTGRTGLLERNGRFYARKVIPVKLRPFFGGQTEFQIPLGPDRREANAKLVIAMADFEMKIGVAHRKLKSDGIKSNTGIRSSYPLNANQMAVAQYMLELELDNAERSFPDRSMIAEEIPTQIKIWREALLKTSSGKADNEEMDATIGWAIDSFNERGNHIHKIGSSEWRQLAMALAAAQLEALDRKAERDKGHFDGQPKHPTLVNASLETAIAASVSISMLFSDYLKERQAAGQSKATERRWAPVIEAFKKFLGHDDAGRVTKQDIIRFKDKKLNDGLSVRTVKMVYLAALNAVFNWAVGNDPIASNPITNVTLPKITKPKNSELGFRDDEALKILKVAKAYRAKRQESPKTGAARRWIPILCAFTGARIGELAQLRKEDIFHRSGIHAMTITPEAGTVKSGQFREVPIHVQIIEEGFLD